MQTEITTASQPSPVVVGGGTTTSGSAITQMNTTTNTTNMISSLSPPPNLPSTTTNSSHISSQQPSMLSHYNHGSHSITGSSTSHQHQEQLSQQDGGLSQSHQQLSSYPNPTLSSNPGMVPVPPPSSHTTSTTSSSTTAAAATTTTNPPTTTTTATTTNHHHHHNTTPTNISYSAERIIGNGSFGVVFEAKVVETGDIVAIKKVLQDKRFKNRELQIMRQLVKDPHPNIVQLQHCFYSQGEKPDELYLNLVLEFVPETVYSISRRHQRHSMALPLLYVKLYLYQLCRALSHIHTLGICHRDIKPQNLLVHPITQQLKLCDFGSAKALIPGEPNVSYICSRYYRAPELIFGSTDYTTAIDIWSQGCVGAELLLGQPLFPGDSGVDQLVEIIKVLGTPTKEEIRSMNSNYMEFKFPQIKGCQWKKIFRNKTPDDAVSFIAANLAYTPSKRINPLEGCCHIFFDELRNPSTTLPNNGGPLPPLFNFTHYELQHTALLPTLIPSHIVIQQQQQSSSSSDIATVNHNTILSSTSNQPLLPTTTDHTSSNTGIIATAAATTTIPDGHILNEYNNNTTMLDQKMSTDGNNR